jgi:hypothetical protein
VVEVVLEVVMLEVVVGLVMNLLCLFLGALIALQAIL